MSLHLKIPVFFLIWSLQFYLAWFSAHSWLTQDLVLHTQLHRSTLANSGHHCSTSATTSPTIHRHTSMQCKIVTFNTFYFVWEFLPSFSIYLALSSAFMWLPPPVQSLTGYTGNKGKIFHTLLFICYHHYGFVTVVDFVAFQGEKFLMSLWFKISKATG